MSPTLRRTICLDTVLLFEMGWAILLYESLKTNFYLKLNDFWSILCKFWIKFWKIQFFQKFQFCQFFGLRLRTSSGISTSIESIDVLFLSHDTIFDIFPFRKWPQIEIWTDKTLSNFNFNCKPAVNRQPGFRRGDS